MAKSKRKFFNEFGAPIKISARTLPIQSHIHVDGPLWKEPYPIGDQRYPIHQGIKIEMQDRYGNLHTNHITRVEAEKLNDVLSSVLKRKHKITHSGLPMLAPDAGNTGPIQP